jgi:hypothetical protein
MNQDEVVDLLRNAQDDRREAALLILRPRERKVLELRFGLYGKRTHSFREIGHLLRITKERVRQIQNRALEKLKESTAETGRLLRNWDHIARVQCEYTRNALAMSESQEMLRRLWVAFPECFRETKADETDLFSWQRILQYAERAEAANNEERPPYAHLPYSWMQYIAKNHPGGGSSNCWPDLASIPVFASWFECKEEQVPDTLLTQLRVQYGKVLKGPLYLEHNSVRCVVGWIWFAGRSAMPGEGEIFDENEYPIENLEDLLLVPTHVIRFDC